MLYDFQQTVLIMGVVEEDIRIHDVIEFEVETKDGVAITTTKVRGIIRGIQVKEDRFEVALRPLNDDGTIDFQGNAHVHEFERPHYTRSPIAVYITRPTE